MKSIRISLATLFAFGAIGALGFRAHAEDGKARPAPRDGERLPLGRLIQDADADGDGKASLEQIQAQMPRFPAEHFKTLDKNGDGFLERSEIPRPRAGAIQGFPEKLRAADTNQDRRVSRDEFAAQFPDAPAERFAALDLNGDGMLDRQDRDIVTGPSAAAERLAPGRRAAGEDGSGAYLDKLLREQDRDGDGRVTLDELRVAKRGFPGAVFGALDRNGDGALSQADGAVAARAPKAPAGAAPALNSGDKKAEDKKKRPAAEGARKKGESRQVEPEGEMKRKALDVNNDGTITFEEARSVYPNYTRERFNQRDKNGDGVITKADRAQQ